MSTTFYVFIVFSRSLFRVSIDTSHLFPEFGDEEPDGVLLTSDEKPPHFARVLSILHPDALGPHIYLQCGDKIQVLEFLASPFDDLNSVSELILGRLNLIKPKAREDSDVRIRFGTPFP